MLNAFDFGAVGDGATNDYTALAAYFSAASTYGFPVILPKKVFVCNTSLTITSGLNIISHGATIKTTSDSVVTLTASGADDWVINGKLTLKGTRTTTGQSAAGSGIAIADCRRYMVDKLVCRDFKGYGIKLNDAGTSTRRAERGQFNMIQVLDNTTGLYLPAASEYNMFSNIMASGNDLEAEIIGGNNLFSLFNSSDGGIDGVKFGSGTNDNHGTMVAFNLTHHSGFNLKADGVSYGQTLGFGHVAANNSSTGKVIFNNSKGMQIIGGFYDATIENTGSDRNFASHVYKMGSLYSVAGSNPSNFHAFAAMDPSSGFTDVDGLAIASQAEAEAGTVSNKLMTPERTAQAIAVLGGGGSGTFSLITGGTSVGDMTTQGGLSVAFDGTTSAAWGSGASVGASTGSGYIGKDWGSGVTKTVTKYEIFGTNDFGYDSTHSTYSITETLKGSSDGSTWTTLHTTTFSDNETTNQKTIASGITTTTAYRYHAVFFTGAGGPPAVSEIKFYETI